MDYMIMHWDDVKQLETLIHGDYELGDGFPDDIGSAMGLLRYEKIGRWEAKNWFWAEDPELRRFGAANRQREEGSS